ncbi:MAG: glycosyltransferase, partial [Bacteroidia bacterium]|nr:glycosyltransferase [Bacteroidia bacterium]
GTPFITTSIGAEGLRLDFPKQVVDDPADFIRYSVKLYYDRELWNESLARGLKHVKQHFEFEGHAKRLVDRILEISDLTNHRQNHFLSAVLWHQSLQSTRYLSKWIEEKNKNKK